MLAGVWTRGLIAAGIAASIAIAMPATATAATIPVTTGADELNTGPGTCSLREAVQAANTNAAVDTCVQGDPGADTIVLTGGTTYSRGITGPNEQVNATGDLDIIAGEPVTIQVSGPGVTAISGSTLNTGDRVIENFADGTVIDGVEILSGNVSGQGGGGIRNAGTLVIRNSTVTGNVAGSFGGGIANGPGETLTATNVTVFDNQANQTGGGIDTDSGSNLNLNNVSIVGNSTTDTLASNDGGGGFYAFGNLTTVTLSNSIVEGNLDTSIPGPGSQASDCGDNFPTITSQGNNLIGSLDNCSLTPVAGDLVGTSAALGPLSQNGGGTRTLPLTQSSPAYNAGNDALAPGTGAPACAATDQRGIARPQEGRCDIGAYEAVRMVPTGGAEACLVSPSACVPVNPAKPPAPKKKCKKKGKKAGAAAKKKGCKKKRKK